MNKLLKTVLAVAVGTSLCLTLFGCDGNKTESPAGSASALPQNSAAGQSSANQLPNPMKKTDKAGLETLLGIPMTEPEGAQDTVYYTISDTMAHIAFTLDGDEYIFRASKTEKDIAGIYEEFKDEKVSIEPGEITVRYTVSGGSLGAWTLPESKVNFTLYSSTADVQTLCSTLYALNTPEGERVDD